LQIAFVGNPNSGKTTLFNKITHQRYKTANFPGTTVEKKVYRTVVNGVLTEWIDLPGTYSLHPIGAEQEVVLQYFIEEDPDLIVYVLDPLELERQLLLLTQLADLDLPILVVFNKMDLVEAHGYVIDIQSFSEIFKLPAIGISAKTGEGIDQLKEEIERLLIHKTPIKGSRKWYELYMDKYQSVLEDLRRVLQEVDGDYRRMLILCHVDKIPSARLDGEVYDKLKAIAQSKNFRPVEFQIDDTLQRYREIEHVVRQITRRRGSHMSYTEKVDRLLTHPIWGVLIFVGMMFMVFQAVFSWASYPMDAIDRGFVWLQKVVGSLIPEGAFRDFMVDGLLAGVQGVMVFVPQIALMFLFIVVMEKSGYLARVVFLFDGLMRRFGMDGRSLISLLSGTACAIPAIMSTRIIQDPKSRLITLFVTPLMSCSARIPVYIMLIEILVPDHTVMGWINVQGLIFLSLYLMGLVAAIGVAWIMKRVVRSTGAGLLTFEMPMYLMPDWRVVGYEIYEKVRAFVVQAGRIIVAISIVLWFLLSYAPGDWREGKVIERVESIEESFAASMGRMMEPLIRPIGYDWKIGIGLISAFAAREVFIGTMSTIYHVEESNPEGLKQTLLRAVDSRTGRRVFNTATSASLLIFFVLAMQCMSTLAVTVKETGSWKIALMQWLVMTGMAYVAAYVVYSVLS